MPTILLRRGDDGAAVRDLQERLAAGGYDTAVDGVFDERTEAAVRAFQEKRGIRVDGICGPETWGVLIESAFRAGDRLLYLRAPMLRGDDVAEVQRKLNALGFDAGREDGILGPATESAIRGFQREAGIATDGVCGPATLAELRRLGALAAGTLSSVREREGLRRDLRRLDERRIFLVAHPGLESLAREVARGLREAGAHVVLDVSGEDPSVVAAEANRYEADLCLTLGSGPRAGCRCAYFATDHFRSEGGFSVASRITEELIEVLDSVEEPARRSYRILRETRMAAVAVELFSTDDADAAAIAPHIPDLAPALVRGVRRGVEEPPDLR
jgi:N-acetylmuramoyl-L-alanine amidase